MNTPSLALREVLALVEKYRASESPDEIFFNHRALSDAAVAMSLDHGKALSEALEAPRCSVGEMHTSGGASYWVCIFRNGECMTPNKYSEKWQAEYDVACWEWFLNGGPKPNLMDFGPPPPTSANGSEVGHE